MQLTSPIAIITVECVVLREASSFRLRLRKAPTLRVQSAYGLVRRWSVVTVMKRFFCKCPFSGNFWDFEEKFWFLKNFQGFSDAKLSFTDCWPIFGCLGLFGVIFMLAGRLLTRFSSFPMTKCENQSINCFLGLSTAFSKGGDWNLMKIFVFVRLLNGQLKKSQESCGNCDSWRISTKNWAQQKIFVFSPTFTCLSWILTIFFWKNARIFGKSMKNRREMFFEYKFFSF